MPELPEVEIIRRDLADKILHRTITAINIIDPRVIRQPQADFARRLRGQKIQAVCRRGKALILDLSSGEHLIVQVMMTGQLIVNGAANSHTRVVFDLGQKQKLLYNDQRVFGRMRVVKQPDEINYFRVLGPEPFAGGFNSLYIKGRLKKSSRPIKNVLMDHTFVAGVGNIYACEILFRCGISPKRRADRVKSAEIPGLQRQTVAVLKEAIDCRGSSMRNYVDAAGEKGTFNQRIRVYARAGKPCQGCGRPVVRIVQAGRGTFYCSHCQR